MDNNTIINAMYFILGACFGYFMWPIIIYIIQCVLDYWKGK